jgi:tetratricopeptide (TPR) repeat protein
MPQLSTPRGRSPRLRPPCWRGRLAPGRRSLTLMQPRSPQPHAPGQRILTEAQQTLAQSRKLLAISRQSRSLRGFGSLPLGLFRSALADSAASSLLSMSDSPSSQSLLMATRYQSVELLLQESRQWLQYQRYGEALGACDRALALDPTCVKAWLCRGRILSLDNRHEEALIAHQRAAALEPKTVAAWYNQAIVLDRLQRRTEAILALEKTLELYPQFSEAWFKRGQFLEQLKQYQEAFLSYNYAIEVDHYWVKASLDRAWSRRAWCLNVLGKYKAALDSYEAALRLNSEDLQVQQERVQVLQKIGQIENEKPKPESIPRPQGGTQGDALDSPWGWAL